MNRPNHQVHLTTDAKSWLQWPAIGIALMGSRTLQSALVKLGFFTHAWICSDALCPQEDRLRQYRFRSIWIKLHQMMTQTFPARPRKIEARLHRHVQHGKTNIRLTHHWKLDGPFPLIVQNKRRESRGLGSDNDKMEGEGEGEGKGPAQFEFVFCRGDDKGKVGAMDRWTSWGKRNLTLRGNE